MWSFDTDFMEIHPIVVDAFHSKTTNVNLVVDEKFGVHQSP